MRIKNIVAAIDIDEDTADIIAIAKEQGEATGAHIHVLHVYSNRPREVAFSPYIYPPLANLEDHEEELQGDMRVVRDIVTDLHGAKIGATGYMKPVSGSLATSVNDFTKEHDADLLIIGTHRPGRLSRIVIGSIAEAILRQAEIPTLVVPRIKGEKE